jgi:outer membrane autotransporter protein
MIGTDILYNEWLFGVAAGIYNQTMEMDLSGEYSGAASHISGFMSYGDEGWILEGSVSIANSALDFESDGIFELDAEYEASDTSIYLGTGYVMKDEKSAWIPEVGLLISSYSQDDVMDNTEVAVPVKLKEFSQSSMQMRLGISGVFRRGFIGRELLSQLKVRWMNHISVLDDEVDFSLTDGSEIYQMPLLTPSKSLLEVGLSAQLRMNRSLSLLMGFDLESGGGYSANRLNAGLRYNF